MRLAFVLLDLESGAPTTGRSFECRPIQTGYALIVCFTKDRDCEYNYQKHGS